MNQRKTNNTLWYSLGLAAVLSICLLVSAAGTTLARYRQEEKTALTIQVRPTSQIYMGTMRLVPKVEPDTATTPTETTASTDPAAEETPEPDAQTEMVEIFDPAAKPEWINAGADTMQMRLIVANGTSDTDFSKETQRVKLQLVGTLGLWNGTEAAAISVQVPAADLGTEKTDPVAETTVPAAEATVPVETTAPEQTGDSGDMAELEAAVTYIEEGSLLYSTYGNGWLYTFLLPDGETEYIWTLPGGKFSYIDLMITMNCATVSNPSFLQPRIISELITE